MKTVRQIRQILFSNPDFYAVIGCEEFTNAAARRALYDMPDQDAKLNVLQQGDCVFVY
jgi:hypothetical protein